MIDTDKYEGHDNWEGTKVNMANEANKLLIADAPLLLEEVKRLRGVSARVWDLMQNSNHEEREMFFWGINNDNTGWMKVHEELAMKELNWGEEK